MASLPPPLAEALMHMQRPHPCPDDVRSRVAALRVPADEVSGTRMTTNWRAPMKPSGGGGGSGGGGWPTPTNSRWGSKPAGQTLVGSTLQPAGPRRPFIDRALAPRFGNKNRTDVSTEDRMMDRIRDKMNKFSPMTYDATKTWLSQLLDSGETNFLTGFITLVFEKAASEPAFCALYARLITELRADFPHLDSELHRLFDAFMTIFEEADEPDVGSAEYAAFLELRERRKFRRGYAAFISEVTRLGVLTPDALRRTCVIVLDGLYGAKGLEGKGLLCEEYAECLTTIMKNCTETLRPVIGPLLPRIRDAMDRTGAPSMTNKARFALMDIVDLFA